MREEEGKFEPPGHLQTQRTSLSRPLPLFAQDSYNTLATCRMSNKAQCLFAVPLKQRCGLEWLWQDASSAGGMQRPGLGLRLVPLCLRLLTINNSAASRGDLTRQTDVTVIQMHLGKTP